VTDLATPSSNGDLDAEGPDEVWSGVVGQDRAVGELRRAVPAPVHAYLFVGPRGSGKRALAAAFAAELLADGTTGAERDRNVVLALAEEHPDLVVVEREGASISAEQADFIVDRASRSPVEGARKVLVLDEFHLVSERVGPKLLKTIEEPPVGTFFIVLAEEVTPDLVTIASRCVQIDLGPVPVADVAARLVSEGIDPSRAGDAAVAAAGDLRRARVLATDDRLALRRDAWFAVPDQLDGSGASAVRAADGLIAMIDDALAPLKERQTQELEDLEERVTAHGERGAGRRQLTERHKREERRYRTDEIRFGLLTLSRRYRDEMVSSPRPDRAMASLQAIQDLSEHLIRNPNVRLQLLALFLKLGSS
jgi:DNA polymerase III subunit delta'